MYPVDISKEIKKFKKGWVILDKNYKVLSNAESFEEISEKIEQYPNKDELVLLPVSDNYFGYVT